MYNAVIDTNVLVSGLLSVSGNPAKIINAFKERQFNLVYSSEIFAEYSDVLNREKFGLNAKDVEILLDDINRVGLAVDPSSSDITFKDEDDRIFYDTALASEAVLVTGNIKHYPAEPFILTPAEFLKILNS